MYATKTEKALFALLATISFIVCLMTFLTSHRQHYSMISAMTPLVMPVLAAFICAIVLAFTETSDEANKNAKYLMPLSLILCVIGLVQIMKLQ